MPSSVYRLRVVLREVGPLIWRRLLVRSDTSIAELHVILQTLLSWNNTHLHPFRIHGKAYGIVRLGGISFVDDPLRVQLCDFRLHRGERLFYEYDFTDGWVLEIRLEAILSLEAKGVYSRFTAGRRVAPPEDCAGPWAYLSTLDRHETPPWEALAQAAAAVQRYEVQSRAQVYRRRPGGGAPGCLSRASRRCSRDAQSHAGRGQGNPESHPGGNG